MTEFTIGPTVVTAQQLCLVGCLIGSYLFSFIYYSFLLRSKNDTLKHLYMIAVANLFLFACYSITDILQVYAATTFTFVFSKLFKKYWWMPLVNFIVILAMLSASHLYIQFGPLSSVDKYVPEITGVLMIMTIKLTSFAFDIRDAFVWSKRRPIPKAIIEEKSTLSIQSNITPSSSSSSVNSIASERSSTSVLPDKLKNPSVVDNATKFALLKRYPSHLEFLGYALLFPGVLTGPTVTLYEYRSYIDGSYFHGLEASSTALSGRKRRAFYLVLVSFFSIFVYGGLSWKFPVTYVLEDEFIAKPLWYRFLYSHMANLVFRSKYYFAWMVSEGSYVIIGLGFRQSSSGKALWDHLENVNPFRIELNSDFRYLVSSWNVCTNQWLYNYVYRRIQSYYGKDKSSARATIVTNLVSAFWHGFYPGYYLMFASVAWMTVVSRLIYKNVTWPFGSTCRRILLFIPLFIMLNYLIVPFELLTFKRGIKFWSSLYFSGHIVLALITVAFLVISHFRKKAFIITSKKKVL